MRRVAQIGLAAALVALPLAGFAPAAHARTRRPRQAAQHRSGQQCDDDLKQKNIFIGHVVATKGTIVIKADRVEVIAGPAGLSVPPTRDRQEPVVLPPEARRASTNTIEGNAVRIDYDGKQDLATLTNRAVVAPPAGPARRFRTKCAAASITYDGQKDFYTAKAGRRRRHRALPTGHQRARDALAAQRQGRRAAHRRARQRSLRPRPTIQGTPQQ